MPGFFITLDGIDGTGKTTQCAMLADWLRQRGYAVTACVDPGGTAFGQQIRTILLDHRQQMTLTAEMFLFMASRAELVQQVIRPALAAHRVVISDRYLLANVVYQGHAGGLSPDKIWEIGTFGTGNVLPDVTCVFDLPLELALERRGKKQDRMEQRDREFHQRVRDGFLAEVRMPRRTTLLIDAQADVASVFADLTRQLLPLLPAPGG